MKTTTPRTATESVFIMLFFAVIALGVASILILQSSISKAWAIPFVLSAVIALSMAAPIIRTHIKMRRWSKKALQQKSDPSPASAPHSKEDELSTFIAHMKKCADENKALQERIKALEEDPCYAEKRMKLISQFFIEQFTWIAADYKEHYGAAFGGTVAIAMKRAIEEY